MTPTPDEGVRLGACPFCGGEAEWEWHSGEPWVQCSKCFAVGPNDENTTAAQHEAAWNDRTPAPLTLSRERVAEVIMNSIREDHGLPPCSLADVDDAAPYIRQADAILALADREEG